MKVKLTKGARMPTKSREGDAGYDFFILEDVEIEPHSTATIDTGVCVELPEGYAGCFAMRSSVCRCGLIMQQPLIDGNFRGELRAIIYNPTDYSVRLSKGSRAFSLFVFPVYSGELEQVDELSPTERGESWSGSSGK